MPVNESKARSLRQWEIWEHSGAVGTLKQSSLEQKRRIAGMEFRQGRADVHSFHQVRDYLTKVIDDYEERFGDDDAIAMAWHEIRATMLDSFGEPDYLKKSRELTVKFERDHFTDPKTEQYSENEYTRVQPMITEITHIVSRGK